ncbi:hypothetical protein ACLQ3K_22245 [Tsukamurella sp. DT100]|uniref:hypothetical protein n=1 Tax=Tsukamurella sp. DT100 TaxID=3393415 RepID=UPI003CF9663F
MIRRGSWVPLLPRAARYAVVSIVPIEPILRGFDYALPGAETAQQLSIIERAMPMPAWGAMCVLAGVLALVGFLGLWRRVAIAGLWVGGSTYVALAVGQWVAVLGEPWLDGIRGPGIVTIFALAQLGMALGYAQQPDDLEADACSKP